MANFFPKKLLHPARPGWSIVGRTIHATNPRGAKVSEKNKNTKKYKDILKARDDAIKYMQYNSINGDNGLARKSWKEKSSYHARSLVETTMWQIKSHCTDRLRNKKEDSRATQAKIKCKIINLIIAA